MKLIIVDRSKPDTFARLTRLFADDLNVAVVWERRTRERRKLKAAWGPERRSAERRRFSKAWNGKDYLVMYTSG